MATFFLTTASLSDAQQPKKVFPIGYLSANNPAAESARAETIRMALRGLDYVQGQNIAFEYRYAEGKIDRLPELAAELERLKVDIILAAGGTNTVRAAMSATKTTPIVMVGAGVDPVEAGLIESLAHPGGNVTGITNLDASLAGKWLEVRMEFAKLTQSFFPISDSWLIFQNAMLTKARADFLESIRKR
jgi:putative ABC transport system substrate-binding protein